MPALALTAGVAVTVRAGSAGAVRGVDAALDPLPRVRPVLLAVLVACTAAHFAAAAVAAAAAGDCPGRRHELVLLQFASAAANRVTPAGLGGSAVFARYLCRRWNRPLAAAVGAVAALVVLGAVADLVLLAVVATVSSLAGSSAAWAEFAVLARSIARVVALLPTPLLAVAAAVAISLGAGLHLAGRRRAGRPTVRRGLVEPVVALLRRPRALATVLLGSAMTTCALGIGFAVAAHLVPDSGMHASFAALVIGYLLAAAAAGALPLPSSFGTADAALIAVLVAAGAPPSVGVADVVLFRVITYWCPALVGLVSARRLRRDGAL